LSQVEQPRAGKKFNIDWVPTLLLGHKKSTGRGGHKKVGAKRTARSREHQLVKKPVSKEPKRARARASSRDRN